MLNEVHAPELLTLALLYHDVGKWRDDDHATESVGLAQPMLARLQLPPEARQTVEFLIRHHLAMSPVVFRRDSDDPDVVSRFAALVGREERLKMLCLMTWADIDAVAPARSRRGRKSCSGGCTSTPTTTSPRLRRRADRRRITPACEVVVAGRPDDITEAELCAFPRRPAAPLPGGLRPGDDLPPRPSRARPSRPDEVHASLERHDDIWELTVATLDKPFLFSNISGVLSYFGMDIHRGQAMTTPDHLVLDVFEFSDDEGFLRQNAAARAEIARVLQAVVSGAIDVTELLRGRERSVLHRRRARRARSSTSTTSTRRNTRCSRSSPTTPRVAVPHQPRRVATRAATWTWC